MSGSILPNQTFINNNVPVAIPYATTNQYISGTFIVGAGQASTTITINQALNTSPVPNIIINPGTANQGVQSAYVYSIASNGLSFVVKPSDGSNWTANNTYKYTIINNGLY